MDNRKHFMNAVELYNTGNYTESHKILLSISKNASKSEDKKLGEALIIVAEAMNAIINQQWENAKDLFLLAWRSLRELKENGSVDIDHLKEECYTAAVAAERIVLGEAEEFDPFYVPRIEMK